MKDKIMAVLGKAKDLMMKAMAASPLLVGIAIGYFGKPVIQLAIDAVMKGVHLLLKI